MNAGPATDGLQTSVTTQHRVRYLETDAQRVVFNMWYLGYADEACVDFLEGIGAPYPSLLEIGYDFQVVSAKIDWRSALEPRDLVELVTSCTHVGTTSFTVTTHMTTQGRDVATVDLVYVGVTPEGTSRPIPDHLRAGLEHSLAGARS